jgi:hypothetical protein
VEDRMASRAVARTRASPSQAHVILISVLNFEE